MSKATKCRAGAYLRLSLFSLVTLCSVRTRAIIFPLLTDAYDDKKNVVDYSYCHARGAEVGHFFNEAFGATFLGVAIAPNWVITANHTAALGGVHLFYDSTGKSHEVIKVVPCLNHPAQPDLALLQVRDILPFYSRIPKQPTSAGQECKAYGLSSSAWAHGALRGVNGQIQARFNVPGSGKDGLRWGLAKVDKAWPGGFSWLFNPYIQGIGDDCAGAATGDSGGGVFLRTNSSDSPFVLGIMTQATGSAYKVSNNPKDGTNCVTNPRIWDADGLYDCGTSVHLGPSILSGVRAEDIGFYTDAIYSFIAPPIRLSATKNVPNWKSYSFASRPAAMTNYTILDASSTMDGLIDPAPEPVYRILSVIPEGLRNQFEFHADNLLRNEKYRIRLHFGAVEIPASVTSRIADVVTIRDAKGAHPFGPVNPFQNQPSKSNIFEVPGTFTPGSNNRISGAIIAKSGTGNFAAISGVEFLLVR
jgi:hypothetical protein